MRCSHRTTYSEARNKSQPPRLIGMPWNSRAYSCPFPMETAHQSARAPAPRHDDKTLPHLLCTLQHVFDAPRTGVPTLKMLCRQVYNQHRLIKMSTWCPHHVISSEYRNLYPSAHLGARPSAIAVVVIYISAQNQRRSSACPSVETTQSDRSPEES